MIERPTDEELTIAIINSDLKAFRVLHKRYYEPLYRFVRRRTPEEAAKDLMQDLFLRLWEVREKLTHKSRSDLFYTASRPISARIIFESPAKINIEFFNLPMKSLSPLKMITT